MHCAKEEFAGTQQKKWVNVHVFNWQSVGLKMAIWNNAWMTHLTRHVPFHKNVQKIWVQNKLPRDNDSHILRSSEIASHCIDEKDFSSVVTKWQGWPLLELVFLTKNLKSWPVQLHKKKEITKIKKDVVRLALFELMGSYIYQTLNITYTHT